MRTLKKYLWVILFNALTAAIIFVPTGMYIYNKFGFSHEAVEITTKVSVIGIFFLVIFGLYMLSAFNHWIKKCPSWGLRFTLQTMYSGLLVGGCVYLVGMLCDTVDVLAVSALKSITDLTAAISYASILLLVCFVISRVSVFFSCWFMSKIEDMATLKKTERAQREIEKVKARADKKRKKKEIYLDD